MNYCRSCLKETKKSFCSTCRKKLFNGALVSHVLPFSRPEFNDVRLNRGERLSISGVQTKYSLKLNKNKLELAAAGGEYIIKPIPLDETIINADAIPANEHITMQLAGQVFGINIPPNCVMQFTDGALAYVVKRFDVLADGRKLLQEDFAQVAKRTEVNGGKNYKYDFSYEEIAELLKKYVPAYNVEVEKFYSLVLFNYIIGNGDAHLKNFSVFRNEVFGDYTLTPAYDLLNTRLHVTKETDTALELFKGGYQTEAYKFGNKFTRPDFIEFGLKIGMKENRILKIIDTYLAKQSPIKDLLSKSFLTDELQQAYLNSTERRIERLQK